MHMHMCRPLAKVNPTIPTQKVIAAYVIYVNGITWPIDNIKKYVLKFFFINQHFQKSPQRTVHVLYRCIILVHWGGTFFANFKREHGEITLENVRADGKSPFKHHVKLTPYGNYTCFQMLVKNKRQKILLLTYFNTYFYLKIGRFRENNW